LAVWEVMDHALPAAYLLIRAARIRRERREPCAGAPLNSGRHSKRSLREGGFFEQINPVPNICQRILDLAHPLPQAPFHPSFFLGKIRIVRQIS
jgi:hypothetical protein